MKIGIYAPSTPAHIFFEDKYNSSLARIKKLNFDICEGELVKKRCSQGYRTANAQMRASELMKLVEDDSIDIIMPVLGGYNTASILPYLDFDIIEKSKKIFCGYSDVSALHLAILSKTSLSTIYGAAVIPTFGEFRDPFIYSEESFVDCLTKENYDIKCPDYWSNEFLNAFTDEWKKDRKFQKNNGWKILNPGVVVGEVIVTNINTLVSLLGTEYVPNFNDKILILEEMDASIDIEERNLNALKLAGIFDNLKALIFSKPEKYDCKGSNIRYEELILEFVGQRDYAIVYNFDCGHTHPSISIPQKSIAKLHATDTSVTLSIIKNAVYKIMD